MAQRFDPRCEFTVETDEEAFTKGQEQLKRISEWPLYGYGCKVIKHPHACVICVMNDHCDRIPLHPGCRCQPDFVVEDLD